MSCSKDVVPGAKSTELENRFFELEALQSPLISEKSASQRFAAFGSAYSGVGQPEPRIASGRGAQGAAGVGQREIIHKEG